MNKRIAKKKLVKRKGFTLIELLSIIVVLAIIALITVPLVLKTIESARRGAFIDSTYSIFEAVDYYLLENNLADLEEEGLNVTELNIKNNKFTTGLIKKINNNYEIVNVSDGNYCASGPMNDLFVYKGACDVNAPTCSLEIIDGDLGTDGWYGSDVTIKMTTSIAESSGISYGIGKTENYTNNVSVGKKGTLNYDVTDEGVSEVICYVKSLAGMTGFNSVSVSVDKTEPVITQPVVSEKTATYTVEDNIGIVGYSVTTTEDIPGTWTAVERTTSLEQTYTATTSGIYFIHVIDKVGKTSFKNFTISEDAFCAIADNTVYNFNYTGGMQTFVAPCAGRYTLQVWGSQGASNASAGGTGSYAIGTGNFSKNSSLYIYVGGTNGYNGGAGGASNARNGGGASDIRYMGTATNNRIVVAGGGSGAMYVSRRDCGCTGSYSQVGSANPSSNGVLGSGSGGGTRNWSYSSNSPCGVPAPCTISGTDYYGGGGGGYYGGQQNSAGTSYVSPTLTGASTSTGARGGSGYARITFLGK